MAYCLLLCHFINGVPPVWATEVCIKLFAFHFCERPYCNSSSFETKFVCVNLTCGYQSQNFAILYAFIILHFSQNLSTLQSMQILTSIVTIFSFRPFKGLLLGPFFKHCSSSQKSPVQSMESSKLLSWTGMFAVSPLFAFQWPTCNNLAL